MRLTAHGTNTGPLAGFMAPTGNAFTAKQVHWFRVANGKLAEHWAVRDDLSAMMQLGVIQRPGPPSSR